MTALDPTDRIMAEVYKDRAEGFQWALDRLIELIAEEARQAGGDMTPAILDAAVRAVDRLHVENVRRQAERLRAANLAPGRGDIVGSEQ